MATFLGIGLHGFRNVCSRPPTVVTADVSDGGRINPIEDTHDMALKSPVKLKPGAFGLIAVPSLVLHEGGNISGLNNQADSAWYGRAAADGPQGTASCKSVKVRTDHGYERPHSRLAARQPVRWTESQPYPMVHHSTMMQWCPSLKGLWQGEYRHLSKEVLELPGVGAKPVAKGSCRATR